jgi:hypothetical protein
MAKTKTKNHIYGDVENKSDLSKIFAEIREDVSRAKSRTGLTELYRRAAYLITLTNAPSWEEKFGNEIKELRELAESEFAKTAHKINQKAKEIDTEADYDDQWGGAK